MNQSEHVTKLYIYSLMWENLFNLQSISLKIWET